MDLTMKALQKLTHATIFTAFSFSLVAGTQAAGTLSGKIGVQLVIGSGCTINNNSIADGNNEWGTLNFGTQSSLNNIIDGSVTGSDGAKSVSVICSEGLSPTLSLDAGQYGSGNTRNLSSDGGTTLIPYRLYSDSARSSVINPNTPFSLTDSSEDIPVYGRILPADQTKTAPAAGTYTDIVLATLAW